MKKAQFDTADSISVTPTASTGSNVMEGAPSGLPVLKAGANSVTDRPHILAKRSSRWNRRAAH
ncbi:MAG: hypothetical protein QNI84_10830 [Henriciella sp.]|nr:hypothetical protein [Henriciella sp.]